MFNCKHKSLNPILTRNCVPIELINKKMNYFFPRKSKEKKTLRMWVDWQVIFLDTREINVKQTKTEEKKQRFVNRKHCCQHC